MVRSDIRGYIWFNDFSQNIGIVIVDRMGEDKAFIGSVKVINGDESLLDIAKQGIKFPIEDARSVIRKLGFNK